MNTKLCKICLKEINLDKDNYVRVTDYYKGKFYAEGFHHNKCYLDRINKGQSKTMEMVQKLMKRTNIMLDNAGVPKKDEEYIIK